MSRSAISLGVGAVMLLCSSAGADPLNLYRTPPDISVSTVYLKYNATSQTLTVRGKPSSFDIDGVSPIEYDIFFGSFKIDATVSNAGCPAGGTMEITGALYSTSDYSSPVYNGALLKGSLSEIGYVATPGTLGHNDIFEFLFTTTDGYLASYYGGAGSTIGIILDANFASATTFSGSFSSSFENDKRGYADVYHVPAPSAVVLACVGLAGSGGLQWLRQRRRGRSLA